MRGQCGLKYILCFLSLVMGKGVSVWLNVSDDAGDFGLCSVVGKLSRGFFFLCSNFSISAVGEFLSCLLTHEIYSYKMICFLTLACALMSHSRW